MTRRYNAYTLALFCALGASACASAAPVDEPLISERADTPEPTPSNALKAPVVLSVDEKPLVCEQECARQRDRAIGYPRTPKQRADALAALAAICRDGGDGACRTARVVVPTGDPRVESSHELSFSLANEHGELMMREVHCGMHKGRLLELDRLVYDLDYFANKARRECAVEEDTTVMVDVSFESGQVMGLVAGSGAPDEVIACVRRAAEHSKTSIDGVCAGTLELMPRVE